MERNRRTREAPPAPNREMLELQPRDRGGRESGMREEDVSLAPDYVGGAGNIRDTGMRRGRDFIPDDMPPIRRMKAGGMVRGDGCCTKGKTKGRMR